MALVHTYIGMQRILPSSLQKALRRLEHRYTKCQFHKFVRGEIGRLSRRFDPGPVPPVELITTTSLLTREDINKQTDPNFYFASGYRIALRFLQRLKNHAFDFTALNRIMELGCGTARLLRHMRCIDGAQLVGTDINPHCIEWCKRHVQGPAFHVNNLRPPLDFAEDESFDFVYAQSVFTHIPLELQQPWIMELRRILRPEGLLICNVAGSHHADVMLNAEDKATLAHDGHLTLDAKHPRASYATQIVGSWDIFQSRDEVRKAFGAAFDILDYEDGMGPNLDLLILRR